jgi:hypothetical protein
MDFRQRAGMAHALVMSLGKELCADGHDPEDLVVVLSLAAELATIGASEPDERDALRATVAAHLLEAKPGFEAMEKAALTEKN